MYWAYRDVSVLVLAPLCGLLAVALDGNLPILATYTQIFMGSVGSVRKGLFPAISAGCFVWQVDGKIRAQRPRLPINHRRLGSSADGIGSGAQLQHLDLRRRFFICRRLRRLPHDPKLVSRSQYSPAV